MVANLDNRPKQKAKILIIEDQPDLQELMVEALKDGPYQILTDLNPLAQFTELEYLGLELEKLDHFYPIKNLEKLNDIV